MFMSCSLKRFLPRKSYVGATPFPGAWFCYHRCRNLLLAHGWHRPTAHLVVGRQPLTFWGFIYIYILVLYILFIHSNTILYCYMYDVYIYDDPTIILSMQRLTLLGLGNQATKCSWCFMFFFSF